MGNLSYKVTGYNKSDGLSQRERNSSYRTEKSSRATATYRSSIRKSNSSRIFRRELRIRLNTLIEARKSEIFAEPIFGVEWSGHDYEIDDLQFDSAIARLLDSTTRQRDAIRMSIIQAYRPLSRPSLLRPATATTSNESPPCRLTLVRTENGERRKRGRPAVSKEVEKSSLLSVRFTEDEAQRIVTKAKCEGTSISKWARNILLDAVRKTLSEDG